MTARIHTRSASPRLNMLVACMTVVLGTGVAASPASSAEIATPRSNHANVDQRLLAQSFQPFQHAHGQRSAPASSAPAATSRAAASFAVNSCTDASLRAALASATTDGDVVDMSALTCSTITLTGGALTASANVTLQGPGQNKLTIDGNAIDRVLSADKSLTVRDLTISNGQARNGGCLSVTDDLNLYDSTISNCVADSPTGDPVSGGGAYVYGAMSMHSSTISGCVAGSQTVAQADGGGAAVAGNLLMQSSTLSDNSAISTGIASGGGAAVGGYAYMNYSAISGNTVTSTNPVGSSKYGLALGGGLATRGVQLVGSVVSNNRASAVKGFAYGGGVHAFVPTYGGSGADATDPLVVSVASTISGNTAHSDTAWSYGGGIAVGKGFAGIVPGSGAALILASTVSGNIVSSGCADCTIQGGGVSAFGQVHLDHSTVRDNQAVLTSSSTGVAYGGGVATRLNSSPDGNDFYDGSIFADQSTISGNSAVGGTAGTGRGGGLAALVSPFVLTNSTISFNDASSSGGGAVQGVSGTLGHDSLLYSTIVANNQAPIGADVATVTSSNSVNFYAEDSLIMATGPRIQFGNVIRTDDPMLQPLACNGGATATHALRAGSPAIDAGSNPSSYTSDQRGEPFVRSFGAGVDIGAFELQDPPDVIFADGFDTPMLGLACR